MTYVRFIEDARGDVVDVEHYCDALCFTSGTGENAYGHGWPCPEQADYDQHCPFCGAVSVVGLDSEQAFDSEFLADA